MSSGAPQPAALNRFLQKRAGDLKRFGRWPTQGKTASQQEKKLAQRLSSHKDSIPADIWQKLQLLSDASQPAEDEQLVAESRDPGHLPREVDLAAQHTEMEALIQAVKERGYYPRVQRNIVCWSKLWDVTQQQEPAMKKLLEDVLYFGRLPHRIKKPTTEPERRENRLATRIKDHKTQVHHTLWELIETHCADVLTVNCCDEAELCFA